MNPSGLSDSLLAKECARCRCGSLARIGSGLCVSCLLRTALGIDPDLEDFDSLLASVDIPDRDWQLGHYRILEEIGRGGMGVIYRARHLPSRRIVALKRVLNYHSDSQETLTRFQREARAAASLDHSNILPIYDVGVTEDGLPFFSMKFAAGGSLLDVKASFREAPRRAAKLISTVACAVDYAHSRGILHRDLKPGNILLDARGEPLVSDFGLAKWLDTASELTRTLTVFGTPGYIAPEQSENGRPELTGATDVYSLGSILFELLTGRPPFLGEHALAVLRQAAENDAPKLRSIVPKASRDLETICARCLERDPCLRYPTAAALAEELERWLEGRPITTRRVLPPTRLYRWSRRNPLLAASFGLCLLLAALSWPKFSEHRQYQASLRQAAEWQHSVTVLPFLDLDNAAQDKETANKVARILELQLTSIGPCRITQTNGSDFLFATTPRHEQISVIARQGHVRKVLTGTKRLIGGKLNLSLHLVDPTRPEKVLTRLITIDRDRTVLGEQLQRERSQYYDWIGSSADPSSNTATNSASSDYVSAGRALMERRTPSDIDKAIECFQKAITADPSSAQAHAFLATAQVGRFFLGGKRKLLELADVAAREAVTRDAQLGEAHRSLSLVLEEEGDLAGAREEVFRTMELDGIEGRSASRLASLAKISGHPELALAWLRIMKHLQNQPAFGEFIIGDCWADLSEDKRAEQAYQQSSDLRPDLPEGWIGICRLRLLNKDFASALRIWSENEGKFSEFDFTLQTGAQCYFFTRHFAEARRMYERLAGKDPDGGGSFYGAVSYKSALGWLNCTAGNKKLGRKLLIQARQHELQLLATAPRHPEILYRIAAINASLGDKSAALQSLRAAASEGWLDFRSLELDPRFDSIRKEAGFRQISEANAARVTSLQRTAAELK